MTTPEALQFTPDGAQVGAVGAVTSIYTPPTPLPVLPRTTRPEQYSAFFAEWTQLVRVVPGPDNHVLLLYAVHSPTKYAANIYRSGQLIAEGLGMDYQPLAWLPDGQLVASDTSGSQLAIRRFRWRGIDQATKPTE